MPDGMTTKSPAQRLRSVDSGNKSARRMLVPAVVPVIALHFVVWNRFFFVAELGPLPSFFPRNDDDRDRREDSHEDCNPGLHVKSEELCRLHCG
jgi:hypothetical protein